LFALIVVNDNLAEYYARRGSDEIAFAEYQCTVHVEIVRPSD
jgi:hypothetical protein